jgi:hypothetical protein
MTFYFETIKLRTITKAFINECSTIEGNKLPDFSRATENITETANKAEKSSRLEYCVCIALKITEVNTTGITGFILKTRRRKSTRQPL